MRIPNWYALNLYIQCDICTPARCNLIKDKPCWVLKKNFLKKLSQEELELAIKRGSSGEKTTYYNPHTKKMWCDYSKKCKLKELRENKGGHIV